MEQSWDPLRARAAWRFKAELLEKPYEVPRVDRDLRVTVRSRFDPEKLPGEIDEIATELGVGIASPHFTGTACTVEALRAALRDEVPHPTP